MPKVSIVMPVYNSKTFLREAIESIILQTFEDWEMIIINEFGSNDGSADIIKDYQQQDERIILVQNEKRLGISASMNIGLDLAQGEYIVRMDADDISLPDRIAEQVAFMDENNNIGISGIKPIIFGDNVWEWKVETDPNIIKSDILFYSPLVHPTAIMRKAELNKYGLRYNVDFRYTEDYELFAKASEFIYFSNIEKPLFRYRMHSSNATNTDNKKGVELYNSVMEGLFKKMSLKFSRDEIDLLSVHSGLKDLSPDKLLNKFIDLDILLKKILFANANYRLYDMQSLSFTLHKRWIDAYENQIKWNVQEKDSIKAEEIYKKSIFHNTYFYKCDGIMCNDIPMVSVVLPTFNSEKYLADTITSILKQTFTDFELLIINEYGSNDDTVKIAELFNDPRIKIVQNSVKLGLAESLNEGIRISKGKYIARVDADDLYPQDRFEKQVCFMEANPDISVCGSWQYHFGNADWIHKPHTNPEDIKAQLLFVCDLCHSTLMLRRDAFVKNDLWYDSTYLSEDYELWTRAVHKLKFATIPEVLGEYRWYGGNITVSKIDKLDNEARDIISRTLNKYLNIKLKDEDKILLSGWTNPFTDTRNPDRNDLLIKEKELLELIKKQNDKYKVYNPDSLSKVLKRRWEWATGESNFSLNTAHVVSNTLKSKIKNTIKLIIKPIIRPLYIPIYNRFINHLGLIKDNILQNLDTRIWKGEQEILRVLDERVWKSELEIIKELDERIWKSESGIVQRLDERLEKNEEGVVQGIKSAIKKSEDMMVYRVYEHIEKSDIETIRRFKELLTENSDELYNIVNEQILKIEAQILKKLDERISKNETEVRKKLDERISKNETEVLKKLDEQILRIETLFATKMQEHIILVSNAINQLTEENKNLKQDIDNQRKQEYTEINEKIMRTDKKITDLSFKANKVQIKHDEKIRILFLFQVASFWPSWESFFNECANDERMEVKVVLFDREINEHTQMRTAKAFLKEKQILYIDYEEFSIDIYRPHILVMQTPYDEWHRPEYIWSDKIRAMGIRIVYIPYGIEIADTKLSRKHHFMNLVTLNAWRVYTFSYEIVEDYSKYSTVGSKMIRVLGHPKFDGLYNQKSFRIPEEICNLARGRKIVLWKVHFPLAAYLEGNTRFQITPYLNEYCEFAKRIKDFSDYFFIFMPHPKFYEMCRWIEDKDKGEELRKILSQFDNVYFYEQDDYRPALLSADYIITDRSAVMIEAGATGSPVLYMYNPDYNEPLTKAIMPLVQSYYQGTTHEDMVDFLEMCRRKEDPRKKEREGAFKKCIPYFDGLAGRRIKEDIIESLKSEIN